MATAPPDLSSCQECRRPVPASNNPDFANWLVTKDERGRPRGMLCPACQEKAGDKEESEATG